MLKVEPEELYFCLFLNDHLKLVGGERHKRKDSLIKILSSKIASQQEYMNGSFIIFLHCRRE